MAATKPKQKPPYDFSKVVNSDGSCFISPRACRVCKGDVTLDGETDGSVCHSCDKRLRAHNSVPHEHRIIAETWDAGLMLFAVPVDQCLMGGSRFVDQSTSARAPVEANSFLAHMLAGREEPSNTFGFATATQAGNYLLAPLPAEFCKQVAPVNDDVDAARPYVIRLAESVYEFASSDQAKLDNPFHGDEGAYFSERAAEDMKVLQQKIQDPWYDSCFKAHCVLVVQKMFHVHLYGIPKLIAESNAGKKNIDKNVTLLQRWFGFRKAVAGYPRIALDLLEGVNLDVMAFGPDSYRKAKLTNAHGNYTRTARGKAAAKEARDAADAADAANAANASGIQNQPAQPAVIPAAAQGSFQAQSAQPAAAPLTVQGGLQADDQDEGCATAGRAAPKEGKSSKGKRKAPSDGNAGSNEMAPPSKRIATESSRTSQRDIRPKPANAAQPTTKPNPLENDLFRPRPAAVRGVPISRGQNNDSRGVESGSIKDGMVSSYGSHDMAQHGQTQARQFAMHPPQRVGVNDSEAGTVRGTPSETLRYAPTYPPRASAGTPAGSVRAFQAPAVTMPFNSAGSGAGMATSAQHIQQQGSRIADSYEPFHSPQAPAQGYTATPVATPALSFGNGSSPGEFSPFTPSFGAGYVDTTVFEEQPKSMEDMAMLGNTAMNHFGTFPGKNLMQPNTGQEQGIFAQPQQVQGDAGMPTHGMADLSAGFQGNSLMQPAANYGMNSFLAPQDLTGDADESGGSSFNGALPSQDNAQAFSNGEFQIHDQNGNVVPIEDHSGEQIDQHVNFLPGGQGVAQQSVADQTAGLQDDGWLNSTEYPSADGDFLNPTWAGDAEVSAEPAVGHAAGFQATNTMADDQTFFNPLQNDEDISFDEDYRDFTRTGRKIASTKKRYHQF